jgi:hypothetical protein
MSFSPFYIIHLSNVYYIEHFMRSLPPAAEGQHILPYHNKPDSPCEHNLPTPCPPSTPILVQLTNSGRPRYVSVHQGPRDDLIQRLHCDLTIDRQSMDSTTLPLLMLLTPSRGVDTIIRSTSADYAILKSRTL